MTTAFERVREGFAPEPTEIDDLTARYGEPLWHITRREVPALPARLSHTLPPLLPRGRGGGGHGWRAWREPGEAPCAFVLHVTGCVHLPPDDHGSHVLLREVVLPGHEEMEERNLASGPPVLVLERIVVPPADSASAHDHDAAQRVAAVSFHRAEWYPAAPGPDTHLRDVHPRQTQVLILPDDVVIAIEESLPAGLVCSRP